jgi:Protein of unknown function (DUF3089)
MMRSVGVALVIVVAAALAACSSGDDDETASRATTTTTFTPVAYAGYESAVYADPANWLCRGDVDDDVCDTNMDATVLGADGTTKIETFEPVEDAPVDCFYVYPTVSNDPGANSDMTPGPSEELFVVRQQAARLGSECRVFAPMYRQATRGAIGSLVTGAPAPDRDPNVSAPADVLDAWKHYMANDNGGRGVVLVGHSQGSIILTGLIAQEIDPNPALREHLVSAIIPGTTVRTPPDADVGGAFQNVPVCRANDQLACVVSYASYRSTAPPPPNSLFGRPRRGGRAMCANPAALAGGPAPMHPYFGTAPRGGAAGTGGDRWATGVTVETPFVALPDLVTAQCVERDGFSYLELTTTGDPATPRIDNIAGDLTAPWGMHLVDVNVAMGDIVALVHDQIAAYSTLTESS